MEAHDNAPQRRTLEAAFAALRAEGAHIQPEAQEADQRARGADARVRIGYGKEKGRPYNIEIKRWLTPATVGPVIARMREHGPDALLVTNYLTPPVAEALKAAGVMFADAAGNAFLRGPNFIIWVHGRRKPAADSPPRAGRAWQPTGLKLIFALLCNPGWIELGYRDLAARAGVANGTVGWAMRELNEQGFVLPARRNVRGRRLQNMRKLLDRWVEVYAGTFRATTLLGRYRADRHNWWETLDANRHGVLLGAEPAAAILSKYLKPGTITLYAKGAVGALMVEHRLRAARDGDVEIRQRFWPFDYQWPHPNLAPPVLIYADLLAIGDARCLEAAKLVYDEHLTRLFAEG